MKLYIMRGPVGSLIMKFKGTMNILNPRPRVSSPYANGDMATPEHQVIKHETTAGQETPSRAHRAC